MEEEKIIFTHDIKKTIMVKTEVESTLISETYVGLQIQKRRLGLKIKQEDLAIKLGLTRNSIINIEKGRHNPTLAKLKLLCEIFGCSSMDLLGF